MQAPRRRGDAHEPGGRHGLLPQGLRCSAAADSAAAEPAAEPATEPAAGAATAVAAAALTAAAASCPL